MNWLPDNAVARSVARSAVLSFAGLLTSCASVLPPAGGLTTLSPHRLSAYDDVAELYARTTGTHFVTAFSLNDPSGILQAAHHGMHYCHLISHGRWEQLEAAPAPLPDEAVGVTAMRAALFHRQVMASTGEFHCQRDEKALWVVSIDYQVRFTHVDRGDAVLIITPRSGTEQPERPLIAHDHSIALAAADVALEYAAAVRSRGRNSAPGPAPLAATTDRFKPTDMGRKICKRGQFEYAYPIATHVARDWANYRSVVQPGSLTATFDQVSFDRTRIRYRVIEIHPAGGAFEAEPAWTPRFDEVPVLPNMPMWGDIAGWHFCT